MTDHKAEIDGCDAEGWTYNDEEVTCDLPAGHGGPHVDRWAGWEWPSARVIPPGDTQ